jgi:hypothetical protein
MSGYRDVSFTSSLNGRRAVENVTFLDDHDRQPLEKSMLSIRRVCVVTISLFSVFAFIIIYINIATKDVTGQNMTNNSK